MIKVIIMIFAYIFMQRAFLTIDHLRQCELLTGVCDGETVGGLQVVHIVIEVEGFLRRVLVGVVQLDSKPEGAVLLHCGAHEQPAYRKEHVTQIGTLISSFPEHMMNTIQIAVRFICRLKAVLNTLLCIFYRRLKFI